MSSNQRLDNESISREYLCAKGCAFARICLLPSCSVLSLADAPLFLLSKPLSPTFGDDIELFSTHNTIESTSVFDPDLSVSPPWPFFPLLVTGDPLVID